MSEADDRKPVATLAELRTLDARDIQHGYAAGLRGDGHEPSPEFNRSYWHGWRNGMVDSRRMPKDAAQAQLAREALKTGRLEL